MIFHLQPYFQSAQGIRLRVRESLTTQNYSKVVEEVEVEVDETLNLVLCFVFCIRAWKIHFLPKLVLLDGIQNGL